MQKIIYRTAAVLGLGATLIFGYGIIESAIADKDVGIKSDTLEYESSEMSARNQDLSHQAIVERLIQQGYKEIYEVERKGGYYEVKTRDENNRLIELYVDLKTGNILRQEYDD